MQKVISYLKPCILGIFCCALFLFIQGFCELSLPNYMSNIVNVGIQQNGIETSAPEAMSENFYSFFETFMTDSERKNFEKNYKLIKASVKNNDYENFVKKYPLLERENIYVLNTEDTNKATTTFESVCLTMINFFKTYFPNYNFALDNPK